MYARKIAQIADSRRHLRRDSGSLTYRRQKKRPRKSLAKREGTYSRKKPLFLTFLFCVAQFYFLQSSLFAIREIEIEGESLLPKSVIISKLGMNSDFGFWDASSESLEANLESLHRLEGSSVKFIFPDTVRVEVKERVPSFYVAFIDSLNSWYSVDASGVVLEESKVSADALKFYTPYPVRGGTTLRPMDMQVVRFFEDSLTEQMKKTVRVVKINRDRELALKVVFRGKGVWVRLGRPEKLEYKLFLLEQLLSQLEKESDGIKSIDLRYSAPVVTKDGKTPAPVIDSY